MAKLTQEAKDLFSDPKALKLITTVDAMGRPNIAAKGSLMVIDDETIAYAELAGAKTKANLESTKQAAMLACKGMESYQIKGTFQGFQTSGDIFGQVAKLIKEAINVDIKNVGIIKIEEVYDKGGKRVV